MKSHYWRMKYGRKTVQVCTFILVHKMPEGDNCFYLQAEGCLTWFKWCVPYKSSLAPELTLTVHPSQLTKTDGQFKGAVCKIVAKPGIAKGRKPNANIPSLS